jgi:hypothetical protein
MKWEKRYPYGFGKSMVFAGNNYFLRDLALIGANPPLDLADLRTAGRVGLVQ